MADLPSKLDLARTKIQAAFGKAGVVYPVIKYRAKSVTGANAARGIVGTVTNTDTTLAGAYFKLTNRLGPSVQAAQRAGGTLQEGFATIDKVSLTLTLEQIDAARDPSVAVFLVDGVEFRVISCQAEPIDSPLYWSIVVAKAT